MSQKSDDFDFDLSNLDDLGLDDLNDITDIDFNMDLEKVSLFLFKFKKKSFSGVDARRQFAQVSKLR